MKDSKGVLVTKRDVRKTKNKEHRMSTADNEYADDKVSDRNKEVTVENVSIQDHLTTIWSNKAIKRPGHKSRHINDSNSLIYRHDISKEDSDIRVGPVRTLVKKRKGNSKWLVTEEQGTGSFDISPYVKEYKMNISKGNCWYDNETTGVNKYGGFLDHRGVKNLTDATDQHKELNIKKYVDVGIVVSDTINAFEKTFNNGVIYKKTPTTSLYKFENNIYDTEIRNKKTHKNNVSKLLVTESQNDTKKKGTSKDIKRQLKNNYKNELKTTSTLKKMFGVLKKGFRRKDDTLIEESSDEERPKLKIKDSTKNSLYNESVTKTKRVNFLFDASGSNQDTKVKEMFKLWDNNFNNEKDCENYQCDKIKKTKNIHKNDKVAVKKQRIKPFKRKSTVLKPSGLLLTNSNSCDIKNGVVIKIEPSNPLFSDSRGNILDHKCNNKSWIKELFTGPIISKNNVYLKWNNNCYKWSSGTIYEAVCEESESGDTSSTAESDSSETSSSNRKSIFYIYKNMNAWMVHRMFADPTISKEEKLKKLKKFYNNIDIITPNRRWSELSVKLNTKNIVKFESHENLKSIYYAPKEVFVDSTSDVNDKWNVSQEKVYTVIDYEKYAAKTKETISDGGHNILNDVQVAYCNVHNNSINNSKTHSTGFNGQPHHRSVQTDISNVAIKSKLDSFPKMLMLSYNKLFNEEPYYTTEYKTGINYSNTKNACHKIMNIGSCFCSVSEPFVMYSSSKVNHKYISSISCPNTSIYESYAPSAASCLYVIAKNSSQLMKLKSKFSKKRSNTLKKDISGLKPPTKDCKRVAKKGKYNTMARVANISCCNKCTCNNRKQDILEEKTNKNDRTIKLNDIDLPCSLDVPKNEMRIKIFSINTDNQKIIKNNKYSPSKDNIMKSVRSHKNISTQDSQTNIKKNNEDSSKECSKTQRKTSQQSCSNSQTIILDKVLFLSPLEYILYDQPSSTLYRNAIVEGCYCDDSNIDRIGLQLEKSTYKIEDHDMNENVCGCGNDMLIVPSEEHFYSRLPPTEPTQPNPDEEPSVIGSIDVTSQSECPMCCKMNSNAPRNNNKKVVQPPTKAKKKASRKNVSVNTERTKEYPKLKKLKKTKKSDNKPHRKVSAILDSLNSSSKQLCRRICGALCKRSCKKLNKDASPIESNSNKDVSPIESNSNKDVSPIESNSNKQNIELDQQEPFIKPNNDKTDLEKNILITTDSEHSKYEVMIDLLNSDQRKNQETAELLNDRSLLIDSNTNSSDVIEIRFKLRLKERVDNNVVQPEINRKFREPRKCRKSKSYLCIKTTSISTCPDRICKLRKELNYSMFYMKTVFEGVKSIIYEDG